MIFSAKLAVSRSLREVSARSFSTSLTALKSDRAQPTKVKDLDKLETEAYRGNRRLRRFGYEDNLLGIGFLPRLEDPSQTVKSKPQYKPRNAWTEKRAFFGQNDYIDILGEPGKARPTDHMPGVPAWLRGFQGNEYQMLLLKRQQFYDWSVTQPNRYRDIHKRIHYLYKRLNFKTKT